MDILIVILVCLLCLMGIIGGIAPGLPGIPLNYTALWIVQYFYNSFTSTFIIVWTILTLVVLALDYLIPIWFAKKFGATKYGIWGSIIGMVIGVFFTPIGMMLGMLLGAIIGELIGGNSNEGALKSGIATFAGTILTIGVSVGAAAWLSYYLIAALITMQIGTSS